MDRDSSLSGYQGEVVHFVSNHDKEEILAPLFAELGMKCVPVPVDTDQFGTFTGEVERCGSIRATLRAKAQAAARLRPEGRWFLASEDRFGPEPVLGLSPTDLESLLLWDRVAQIEIYAEYLCPQPVRAEVRLGPRGDWRAFLREVRFPDHHVIVRPEGAAGPIHKGLADEMAVACAMLDGFAASPTGHVILATDLRAPHNSTRRQAIGQAGRALIEKLKSHRLLDECERSNP